MNRHLFAVALLSPMILSAQSAVIPTTRAESLSTNGATEASGPMVMRPAMAIRLTKPPVLDGRTDDPIWQDARVIDQFVEFQPNEGAQPRMRTEIRIAYDDRYIYVLGRMFDPAPDSIRAYLSRRDVRTESEWLKVIIDSHHDRRSAYQFIVNPVGVKRDYYVYNEWNEDDSWDGIWDVATSIDSLGWVAEMRIPFSQLRFAKRDEHVFGLMIWRDIARTGQRLSWPNYSRSKPGYISQAGDIGGLTGLPSTRRIELMPYVVTSNNSRSVGDRYGRKQNFNAGGDLKYGLTSNLTLDATINPDFGQVEGDPAVLNLSAFETFQQERRPFFLEGAGIFQFNIGGGGQLFYSRRIGRDPQLRGFSGYGDSDSPKNTSILGAAKLTGRTGGGFNVGVLSALTQREFGIGEVTIEPATHYFVGRLQKEMNEGRSAIGTMLTSVNRALHEDTEDILRANAYSLGIDGRHRMLKDNNYEVWANAAFSRVDGSEAAILRTQRNSTHYYQKPDDDIEEDPTATSLAGATTSLGFNKIGGGVTRFEFGGRYTTPGFETNDIGFLNRADQAAAWAWVGLQYNRPSTWYQMRNMNFNAYWSGTSEAMTTEAGGNLNTNIQLKNFNWVFGGIGAGGFLPVFDDRSSFGGPAKRQSPFVHGWLGWEGDQRKSWTPAMFVNWARGQEGKFREWSFDPSVSFRSGGRMQVRLGAGYFIQQDNEQFHDRTGDFSDPATEYLYKHKDVTVASLSSRVDVTMTPNLTLQVYARPFAAIVDYEDMRSMTNPRAKTTAERFSPYSSDDPGGFRSVDFQSNTVLRWEYRPGSVLFLVWAQNRNGFASVTDPNFKFGDDTDFLFRQRPDNTFLLKASYWFSP